MGVYACLPCLDRYELKALFSGCLAACEICGPLRDDWSAKWTNFTWDITRLSAPLQEQLLSHVTWATEIGRIDNEHGRVPA